MTLSTGTSRQGQLDLAGEENNPFITGAPLAGTYTTTTGTEGLAASNASTESTFDAWTCTPASGEAVLQVVFSGAQAVGFIGIAAHNIGEVGGTVSLEYSTNSGSTWNTTDAADVSPDAREAIAFRLEGYIASHWRLVITGLTDDVSVARVALYASEIVIPQRLYQGYTPPITPTQVELRTNVTQGNNYVATAYVESGSVIEAQLRHIKPAFLRASDWQAFQRRWNAGQPSFWCWRPDRWAADVFYIWRQGGPIVPTNSGPKDYMSFTINAKAYHD